MSDESVSLEFLARQIRGMRDDVQALKDDMRVLTAIVLRHENQLERINASMAEMLNQMRAMVAQHQRFGDRLLALDDRVSAVEDDRR